MSFTITLSLVATMLAYAIPAFLIMKAKLAKESAIGGLAAILLYACTPAIIISSFLKADFNRETVTDMLIFSLLTLASFLVLLGGMYIFFHRHYDDPRKRIATVASAMGNYGFFGIPLLNGLMPDAPNALIFVAIISIFLNFIAFTFGSMIMSGDKKYISVKKLFINPSVLSAAVAIPLFLFGVKIPVAISPIFETFVSISTPLCMFVLGMRLATVKFSSLFTNPYAYLSVFLKQVAAPLIAILITSLIPCDPVMEKTFVILSACPTASVILNISEILGNGQKYAVNTVLLGTLLSIITIPFTMLLCK